MRYLTNAPALLRHAHLANAFGTWLRSDGDRLIAAADLLGGADWAARAAAVVAAIAAGAAPVAHITDLRALRRLLNLELADDLTAFEAELFDAIHPDDPRADDVRICAEALGRVLEALSALASVTSPRRQEAA